MVYECKSQGWMTEKECKDCFQKEQHKEYGHIKHCRRDNVISQERDDLKDR